MKFQFMKTISVSEQITDYLKLAH